MANIFGLLLVVVVMCNGYSTIRKIIHTGLAPGTTLPYSQAVQVDNMVYVSGCLGMDTNGTLIDGFANQTRKALDNINLILKEAQSSLANVIKVNVFLSDLGNYDAMNTVYAEYFKSNFPARAAFQVARIPRDALVEIDVVAIVGDVFDFNKDGNNTPNSCSRFDLFPTAFIISFVNIAYLNL